MPIIVTLSRTNRTEAIGWQNFGCLLKSVTINIVPFSRKSSTKCDRSSLGLSMTSYRTLYLHLRFILLALWPLYGLTFCYRLDSHDLDKPGMSFKPWQIIIIGSNYLLFRSFIHELVILMTFAITMDKSQGPSLLSATSRHFPPSR